MTRKAALGLAALFALTLSLLFPRLDASAERTYFISGYEINVAINSDGSADMEELLTYDFSGQFNGILRDVDFSQSGGLENVKVYAVENQTQVEFAKNQADTLDYQGMPGTYNYVVEGSMAHLKIFEPSENEQKTFIIRYRMKDAVTRYNDTAEFNRKLIGTGWQTLINNVGIKITVPEGAKKEQLRVFAHGPLNGESNIWDDRNLVFSAPSVSPGEFLETRVLFPTSLVPDAKNIVAKDVLPGILQDEQKLADEANAYREKIRNDFLEEQRQAQQRLEQQRRFEEQLAAQRAKRVAAVLPAVLLILVLWFPLIIYLYIKYDREFKHIFEGKYCRELPGEYTPAEMSVLMSMGSVQTRDIMATLLDLVRKRHLVLTTDKVHKKGIFGGKDIDRYTLSLNEKAPGTPLKKHEQFLIDWFLGKIGNGSSVSFDEIEDYVRTRSDALQYRSDQTAWEGLVREEAAKNDFFDVTCKKGRIIGVLLGVLYLLLGAGSIVLTVESAAIVAAVAIVMEGIILTAFSARINRRTAYGNEQHAMWHAFRNFLKDFSRLDKAMVPSIVIWEHYLVYAVSLGVARDVIKQLPLVFNDADLDNRSLTFMYGASYGYFAGFNSMFDNTIHTVEGAVMTAASIANSSNSSGGGFGGGFSGGSSGGGGGGGGGGAF